MSALGLLAVRHSIIKPRCHRRAYEILKRISDVPSPQGAELGVYKGYLSRILLKHRRDMRLVMIDSWEGDGGSYEGETEDAIIGLGQKEMDACLDHTISATEFASSRRNIMRMLTSAAAQNIPDASLDFCFIDADHSYEGCRADIENYLPKMKTGGWLSGHDYDHPKYPMFGVKKAVDEFVSERSVLLELGLNFTWFVRIP